MPRRQRHTKDANSDYKLRKRRQQMISMKPDNQVDTFIPLKTLEDLIAVHLNATSWSNDNEVLNIKMDLPDMIPMKITVFKDKGGKRESIGT